MDSSLEKQLSNYKKEDLIRKFVNLHNIFKEIYSIVTYEEFVKADDIEEKMCLKCFDPPTHCFCYSDTLNAIEYHKQQELLLQEEYRKIQEEMNEHSRRIQEINQASDDFLLSVLENRPNLLEKIKKDLISKKNF